MDWNIVRIFYLILYAVIQFELVVTVCLEHSYTINSETFIWQESPSSETWIPSNCLNDKSQLIFRKCEGTDWVPDNTQFQLSCTRKMNEDEFTVCPPGYAVDIKGTSIKTFCYELNPYGICAVGHISFTDLNIEEQQLLLQHISPFFGDQWSMAHGDSARWWFTKTYYKNIYKNGQINLQSSECARYGMPLEIEKDSVPFYVPIIEYDDVCLSLNITKDPISKDPSAVLTVEQCGGDVLNIFRPFIGQYQCPLGYYRMEYSYEISPPHSLDTCYSIQMFDESVPVELVETKKIIETYCNGNIMQMVGAYEMFLFMEMSREINLTNGNHCLFGLTTNTMVKYSDWDTIDLTQIAFNNFKWDKSMNFSLLSDDSYLVTMSNGLWTWATSTVSCVVCVIENALDFEYPRLWVKFDFLGKIIELEITNQKFLFRDKSSDNGFICFALLGEHYATMTGEIYVSNLTVYSVDHSKSNYLIENVGNGLYWCIGNDVHGEMRSSNVYHAYGMVFAVEVVRKCSYPCTFSESDLRDLNSVLEQNYKFVVIRSSAVVHNGTTVSHTEYHFVAHVRLVLQDDAIVNLDTNLISPLTQHQLETAFIYERLNEVSTHDENYNLTIQSISSTEFCLHETTLSLGAIIWRVSNIGETVPTSVLCPSYGHIHINRTCSVDNVYGTYWYDLVNDPLCYSDVSESLLQLYIHFNDTSNQDLEHLKDTLEENVQSLLPIDVFLTSRIVTKISSVSLHGFELISSIFNSLMLVDEQFLNIAALLNSTNILLDFLDRILLSGHTNSQFIDGNVAIYSPLVEIFILHPFGVGGVSGIALYRPQVQRAFECDFTNYSTRYIYPNESIEEVFSIWDTHYDLVVGSYLPTDMLTNFQNISIAIVVFFNDKLFQSHTDTGHTKMNFNVNGKVISVTIFENDLPSKIPIFFEANEVDNSTCGYWELASDVWSAEGCFLRRMNNFHNLALCECTHLTHFGYLVDTYRHDLSEVNERALTVITIVGSSISLFGSLGIFVTATMFPNWRQKLSSQVLIHFSASIALHMSLMIVSNVDAIGNNSVACVAMGSLLHYSILVMHFWMLIVGYFQFKRYVVVFNFTVSHLLLKSTIFGWIVPLLLVIVVLVSNHSLYLTNDNNEPKSCYPTGWALHYGVLVPIGIIFVVNVFVYLTLIASLNKGVSNSVCTSDIAKYRTRLSQVRLFAFLFFALGLTWVFGILSNLLPNCYLTFTYLFCVTATVQGLVLFFYFIVMDPYVRRLWLRYFKTKICS